MGIKWGAWSEEEKWLGKAEREHPRLPAKPQVGKGRQEDGAGRAEHHLPRPERQDRVCGRSEVLRVGKVQGGSKPAREHWGQLPWVSRCVLSKKSEFYHRGFECAFKNSKLGTPGPDSCFADHSGCMEGRGKWGGQALGESPGSYYSLRRSDSKSLQEWDAEKWQVSGFGKKCDRMQRWVKLKGRAREDWRARGDALTQLESVRRALGHRGSEFTCRKVFLLFQHLLKLNWWELMNANCAHMLNWKISPGIYSVIYKRQWSVVDVLSRFILYVTHYRM